MGRRLGRARVLDISLSGAYMLFDGELEPGTAYRLQEDAPDGPLDLPFRLTRSGPRSRPDQSGARHYGVHFNLTADQEGRLRKFLDHLRRHPPVQHETPIERTLRRYWEL